MTWGFTAQRRAAEFDTLVEASSTSAPASAGTRDAHLLQLVGALRATPEVHARPEFVADLRGELMAAAETALVPADTSKLRLPDRRPTRERRLAAVVGGIAIVGATTSVAVASQSALPGDTLYPIKRVIEGAHTGLSVGEANKGTTALANASNRLDEVDALTQQDGLGDEQQIAGTLNTFTDQATEASDLLLSDYAHNGNESSIAALRDFSSSSLDQLAALEPYIPIEARDELIRAAQVLQTINAETAQRCPACAGTLIDTIPPALVAAEPMIFVPLEPQPSAGSGDDEGKGGKKGHHGGNDLPSVSPGDIGPGSVTDPSTAPSPGSTTAQDPLQQLVDGVTGGGNTSGVQPSIPVVGPVLESVAGTVGDILESVIDPLTGEPIKDKK
jgi:hypothetical protein